MTKPATRSVLVVEDNADTRDTLALLLSLTGVPVACAANGQEALDFLNQNDPPRLILLDLTMPVMDGWQFLQVARRDSLLTKVPVLVLSALASLYEPDLLSLGARGCLQKPADPDILLNAVRQYC